MIGDTPLLEFKQRPEDFVPGEIQSGEIKIQTEADANTTTSTTTATTSIDLSEDINSPIVNIQDQAANYEDWENTKLSGKHLKSICGSI